MEKDFKLGKNVRLGAFADFFNILNNDATQTVQSTIPTSSVFWFPADPVDPRRVMLGTKLRF